MKTKSRLLFAVLAGVATVALAGQQHDMAPYQGSEEFQRMKSLAGHWEGTTDEKKDASGAPMKVTVDYKVTSGGSALVETITAGTPHEMVSVYHDDNGKLAMTHYCMMANQPHLTLIKSTPKEISLSLAPNGNVDPQSAHMHALTISMPAENKLTHKWTSYEGGQPKGTAVFTLTRKG